MIIFSYITQQHSSGVLSSSNNNLIRMYGYKILPTGTVVGMKFYPIRSIPRALPRKLLMIWNKIIQRENNYKLMLVDDVAR